MSKPIRVQRKRIKGYKSPEGTISVTRPGKWGNPFTIEEEREDLTIKGKQSGFVSEIGLVDRAREQAVTKFRDMMLDVNSHDVTAEIRDRFRFMRDRIRDLQGKNLSCFCGPDQKCHADVLIEFANQ